MYRLWLMTMYVNIMVSQTTICVYCLAFRYSIRHRLSGTAFGCSWVNYKLGRFGDSSYFILLRSWRLSWLMVRRPNTYNVHVPVLDVAVFPLFTIQEPFKRPAILLTYIKRLYLGEPQYVWKSLNSIIKYRAYWGKEIRNTYFGEKITCHVRSPPLWRSTTR